MKKFVILSSVSRNKISPLACLPRTTMPALLLLLLVSLNLSIGICYQDGDGDDDPVGCPVRVYCLENNTNILELPGSSSSVKLPVGYINYTSQTLQIYDPKNCLPELFLTLNYSSFYPFRYIKHSLDFDSYDDSLEPTNCTFFDCSSVVPAGILIGGIYYEEYLLSCPIYNSFDEDDVVEANLIFCTKLARHVLPISVCNYRTQLSPSLYFGWSTKTFKSGCFLACNESNKGTQLYKSIYLPLTGAALLFSTLGALIAKKLAIVGLWCIQWHPVQRPSMKSVVQMLEGEESKLKVPPNPFESAAATSSSAIIPARRLNLELEVIPETD
ncbi:hypothetical protein Ahy_B06g086034 [Arachis hypogaea]|uniref:RING-type E3 ubiquitin transferase n=1 Tax=Arachis hypogaea TaxID=3818 RepID=A0A444YWK2_ARAHY|nr:hypothetical protein Ahy_B06g086034 [Arachis hypogaea]